MLYTTQYKHQLKSPKKIRNILRSENSFTKLKICLKETQRNTENPHNFDIPSTKSLSANQKLIHL